MNIIKIAPRGYCHGVVKALNIAVNSVTLDIPKPITILGMIVHNKDIIDELTNLGIITVHDPHKTRLELLEEVNEGSIIFSAHGISKVVYQEALKKGLNIIDASCKDVLSTHEIVESKLKANYQIMYVGVKNHPETEGVLGINKNIVLVQNIADVAATNIKEPLFVTNQTTLSTLELSDIFAAIQEKYPDAEIKNDICNASAIRQSALLNIEADYILVVGDSRSNNSNKLLEIATLKNKIPGKLIANVFEIDVKELIKYQNIAITSGASTPTLVTKQVISYVENLDVDDPNTWVFPEKLKSVIK